MANFQATQLQLAFEFSETVLPEKTSLTQGTAAGASYAPASESLDERIESEVVKVSCLVGYAAERVVKTRCRPQRLCQ